MKKTLLSLSLLIGLLAIGCSKAVTVPIAPIPVTSSTAKSAPAWVDNPATTVPGCIVGIGTEAPNVLNNVMLQRKIALSQARQQIAQQMQVKVQGMFSGVAQLLNANSMDGKKLIPHTSGQRMVEDTMRELVNVQLSGATPRQFWTDPETGNLWVLVTVDKESIRNAALAQIRKELGEGSALLQDATKRMDVELDKDEAKG